MILVGIYGNKKKIITPQLNKGLTDILIHIALPFMIVTSFIFRYDESLKTNIIQSFYYSFLAYIVMIALSYVLILPVKKDKQTILHFANVFPNTGYVGFPILMSIYGAEGVIYGSIFNMFFVILVWTYGLLLYEGKMKTNHLKSQVKKIMLNPSIIAVIIGVILMVFNIQLPGVILLSLQNIGNMTGPLSMIIIGGILSHAQILKYLGDWTVYYGVATKLLIIPMAIYCLFLLLGANSQAATTVIIMTAMPASAMTAIFAENFNKEPDFAAVLVSLSTLLALMTVPVLLKIFVI